MPTTLQFHRLLSIFAHTRTYLVTFNPFSSIHQTTTWPPFQHPPLSILVFSFLYGRSAIDHLLGFHPTTPLSANFTSIFRFSCMRMPNLVITTHLGLPSPSTFDWPNIPPTCWPQCHSLLLSPLFYQFLLISHPIRLSVCPSTQHICPPIHQLHLDSICPSNTSPSTSACLGLEPTHSPVCPGSVPSAVHLLSPLGH